MDILFLLIPLSVVLALVILGALGWAVWRGQFDDVDARRRAHSADRIDLRQAAVSPTPEKL